MMPLSEREKTIIATTITGFISNIFVESPEDFLLLTRALRSLLTPDLEDSIDPELRDRVTFIHDYMEPWFGAADPENREEFISLCKAIIFNRIEYFEHLSHTEKLSYIHAQTNYRQQVDENQARMSRVSAPEIGSESHVLSMQEMLMEMQERFIAEIGATTTQNFILSNWPTLSDSMSSLEEQLYDVLHRNNRPRLFSFPQVQIERSLLDELLTCGFTRELINQWQSPMWMDRTGGSFKRMVKDHVDVLIYLCERGVSPEQAIVEINYLNAYEANDLKMLYSKGLRGEHIRELKNHFSELYPETIIYEQIGNSLNELIFLHHLSVADAIEEIKRLDGDSLTSRFSID